MNPQDIQQVCAHFGLGEVRAVQTAGGTRNRNWIVATEAGRWFIRQRYFAYCAEARLRFDHQALRYMAERGVPVTPPHPGRDGRTWGELDGTVWEVFPFVEGAHVRDGH